MHSALETPNVPALASLASRFVDVAALSWQPSGFPGVAIKVLLEDKSTGLMTALFRWDAGARLPMHEHVHIEQSFVLEGSLADDEGEVTAGNFVWRPRGSQHTAYSPRGALILAFLLEPNRFLDEA